jgi:hypothetical protein
MAVDASTHTQNQIKVVIHPHLLVSLCRRSRGADETSSFLAERQAKPIDVDIKNGKVIFKQKPMSFEKMTETMQGTSHQHRKGCYN